jgi:hypothetical protein
MRENRPGRPQPNKTSYCDWGRSLMSRLTPGYMAASVRQGQGAIWTVLEAVDRPMNGLTRTIRF